MSDDRKKSPEPITLENYVHKLSDEMLNFDAFYAAWEAMPKYFTHTTKISDADIFIYQSISLSLQISFVQCLTKLWDTSGNTIGFHHLKKVVGIDAHINAILHDEERDRVKKNLNQAKNVIKEYYDRENKIRHPRLKAIVDMRNELLSHHAKDVDIANYAEQDIDGLNNLAQDTRAIARALIGILPQSEASVDYFVLARRSARAFWEKRRLEGELDTYSRRPDPNKG